MTLIGLLTGAAPAHVAPSTATPSLQAATAFATLLAAVPAIEVPVSAERRDGDGEAAADGEDAPVAAETMPAAPTNDALRFLTVAVPHTVSPAGSPVRSDHAAPAATSAGADALGTDAVPPAADAAATTAPVAEASRAAGPAAAVASSGTPAYPAADGAAQTPSRLPTAAAPPRPTSEDEGDPSGAPRPAAPPGPLDTPGADATAPLTTPDATPPAATPREASPRETTARIVRAAAAASAVPDAAPTPAPADAPVAVVPAEQRPAVSPGPAPAPAAGTPARPPLTPQLATPLLSLAQAGDGDHRITVTVSPEDLGPVTVRAHISGDTMRIELTAPSDAGRDAIRHILADLRRDLAAAAPQASLALAAGDAGPDTHAGSQPQGQPAGSTADTGHPGPRDPARAAADDGARDTAQQRHPRDPAPDQPAPAPHPPTSASFDVLA